MKLKKFFITVYILFIAIASNAQVNTFTIDSSKFRKELLPILDSIYKSDQDIRMLLIDLNKINANKVQIDSVRTVMIETDKSNLVIVEKIISDYGWLGPQDVGMQGSQALFLVIQHADLSTQKKYIQMIRKAEKDGKTLSSNLAILEDRIAMREGKKQIYGSQRFTDKTTRKSYVYPIQDIDNLDNRRTLMGMPPMKDYSSNWNLEEYKRMLPEIEKIYKEQYLN